MTDTSQTPPTATPDAVLVCANLGDGGTQRVVALLADAWNRRGRRICVVTLVDEPDVYRLPAGVSRVRVGVKVSSVWRRLLDRLVPAGVRQGGKRLIFRAARPPLLLARGLLIMLNGERVIGWLLWVSPLHRPRLLALRRTVEQLRPPVVVAFGVSTNIVTVAACLGIGPRVVVSERNDPTRQPLGFPWRDLRPRAYARADVVTANAKGVVEALRAWVPEQRLRYVPNPLPLPGVAERQAHQPDEPRCPRILIAGRLHKQKAHDVLLHAFTFLAVELREWQLVVAGQGELEGELRHLASRLGLGDRVVWLGQVDDLGPVYRSADIFALPSRHEGMPNALLEAMSFGVAPIVSNASPGPLEVVRDGETGLVVPADDSYALALAIRSLAVSPDYRRKLGEAARAEVARFDVDRVVDLWDEVLGFHRG